MSTGNPRATLVPPRPANRPVALEVHRADRNRWAQHLSQIATYYPLARPRILGGDAIPALALKSRAPLPYATPVSEPAFTGQGVAYEQQVEGRANGGERIA